MSKNKYTIVLSEAQMKDLMLILEAMSVDDIYQKYYSDIPEDIYQAVVTQADPTYNPQKPDKMGIYTKWLLGMVRKGTFKPGDATEARNLLTVFGKFRNKLDVKDVTQLHSMRELYDVVKPFMGQQTTGEKNREAKSGAEKVYEDGKWLVVVPHTEEAAKLYGKGTRWCTAADNDNMFDYYNEDGPLYIIINKSNPSEKYQFHFESDQFMDDEDEEINIEDFFKVNISLCDFFAPKLKEAGYGYVRFNMLNITHYEIPDGTEVIDSDMFYNCRTLTSVTIPDSVISIGERAFLYCSGLTSVTIPNSVTSIGTGAFGGCSGLKSIVIPNSVTHIGASAFGGCSGLTSISIPNSVTSIEGYAFHECTGLKSVNIPNSVTSIEEYAFYKCTELTKIAIPNSVTSIGSNAFTYSGLTSVTIPNSVTKIDYGAFYGCSRLTSISLLDPVYIGKYAFNALPPNVVAYVSNDEVANLLLRSGFGGKIITNNMREQKRRKQISGILREAFYPVADTVLLVKKYLDNNFIRQSMNDISSNGHYGYPTMHSFVASKDGRPLEGYELLPLLDDEFSYLIKDEQNRKKFLKQVIIDWFNNNITRDGLLSVNYIT